MNNLPEFFLSDYSKLLDDLKNEGYSFKLITEKDLSVKSVYLRHDIDYHIGGWIEMPNIEHDKGIKSTYYIMLSDYNILNDKGMRVISALVSMNHEIGLHYDVTKFPRKIERAQAMLKLQLNILSELTGKPVKTAVSHLPSIFEDFIILPDNIVNPFSEDYLKDMSYISDSARGWRDLNLLKCFTKEAPHQLVLATHPENWLDGRIKNRTEYLETITIPNRQKEDGDIKWAMRWADILHNHIGGKAHDERIRCSK